MEFTTRGLVNDIISKKIHFIQFYLKQDKLTVRFGLWMMSDLPTGGFVRSFLTASAVIVICVSVAG